LNEQKAAARLRLTREAVQQMKAETMRQKAKLKADDDDSPE